MKPFWERHILMLQICSRCNKNCQHCGNLSPQSTAPDMSIDDLAGIDCYFDNKNDITLMPMSGGEPTLHPALPGIVRWSLKTFPRAQIVIKTNGWLMDKVYHLTSNRVRFLISEYPGWNDEIISKYRDMEYIRIEPYTGFYPLPDHPLDSDKATALYDRCRKELKVINDRIYPCCLAEAMERRLQINLSTEMVRGWEDKLMAIEPELKRACAYCIRGCSEKNRSHKGIANANKQI